MGVVSKANVSPVHGGDFCSGPIATPVGCGKTGVLESAAVLPKLRKCNFRSIRLTIIPFVVIYLRFLSRIYQKTDYRDNFRPLQSKQFDM